MKINKIQRACEDIVAGRVRIEGRQGWCMAGARGTVEIANGWPSHRFYELVPWIPYRTPDNISAAPNTPWARTVEESFIRREQTVPPNQARAGDLAFARIPADQGHVSVLYVGPDGKLWVLENASVRRGVRIQGPKGRPYWVNTMPLSAWDRVTSIARLPDEWVFANTPDPISAEPVTPVVQPVTSRVPGLEVIVGDGGGRFFNRTGERWPMDLGDGRELIVNSEALKLGATTQLRVYVDVRRKDDE